MGLRRTTSRLAAGGLIWVLGVACTGDDAGTAAPEPTSTMATSPSGSGLPHEPVATATAPAIQLRAPNAPFTVSIRQLRGGVPTSQRAHLRQAAGAPVSAWFEHGFLGLDYPTRDFPAAFASWTTGAARLATRDHELTTNALLGPDLVAVAADLQQVRLFVFARKGVAGGATAKVRLAMTGERQDGSLVDYVVWGDLYLTRHKGRWSIFGYDLRRSQEAS